MNHLLLAALTYVTLVVQTTLGARLAVGDITPCLPLLALVAAVGLLEGPMLLAWGGVIGLCCDCLGQGPLGREFFALTVVALVAGQSLPRRGGCSPLWTLPASFLIVASALVISTALEVTLSRRPVVLADLLQGVVGSAAYTAILAALGRAVWNTVLRVLLSPLSALRAVRD